ncbi:hypothetical protein GCM10010216_43690 [Streptomyces flaveolus]|nr:hypothetical protein GCM10010216_43690 [Streptomyces flaveolus]
MHEVGMRSVRRIARIAVMGGHIRKVTGGPVSTGVVECGGTSSPRTGLCLLRIVDPTMGDYDCQRVAVAVHGVVDLSRQAATGLAYCVAGWLAPGGRSFTAAAGGGASGPLRQGRVRGVNAPVLQNS